MQSIAATTVDGTPITVAKDEAGHFYVNNERVGTITNTPLGVILMCSERGYTINHPTYYRLFGPAASPQP